MLDDGGHSLSSCKEVDEPESSDGTRQPESSDGIAEQRCTWAEMAENGANTSASASPSPQGGSESGSDADPPSGVAQAWLSCATEPASATAGAHPSIGSEGHDSKLCKPCAFYHTKGCTSGKSCLFCHICPPHEKQDRKRLRRRQCQNTWGGGSYPRQDRSGEWRSEHSRQTSGEWRSAHSRQTSGEWRPDHARQMSSASAASTCTGWGNSSEGRRHSRQASTNSQTTAADTFTEKSLLHTVVPMIRVESAQPAMQQYVVSPEMAYASMQQAYGQQMWEYPQLSSQDQHLQPNYELAPHAGYEMAKQSGYGESGFSTPEAPFAPPIEITSPSAAAAGVCFDASSEGGALVLPPYQPGAESFGYCMADGTPVAADPMSPHGSCVYGGVQYAFVPVSPMGMQSGYQPAQSWPDDAAAMGQAMPAQACPQPSQEEAWSAPTGSGQLRHFQSRSSLVVEGPSGWGSPCGETTISW